MDNPIGSTSRRTQVLTVGHCAADHARLAELLDRAGADSVTAAPNPLEARRLLGPNPDTLVLVNRILDSDGASGLEFIRSALAAPGGQGLRIMLISNHADAQQQALALGALPGFGKSELHSPRLVARLTLLLRELQGSQAAPDPLPSPAP